MAQPPHFDIDGAIYFLTTRLKAKETTLSATERAIVRQTILELAQEDCFKLYAYVVMPDHLHILLKPMKGSISGVMKLIKGKSSRKINKGVLWQKGYFDFSVLSEEKFKEKFNYIHNNAVKSCLADRAENYPYSSARAYRGRYKEVFYE
ncbi:MAG: transposase [Syntrophobacterales bacterium]|nr:transposase [Syntrophobacterales bacterium]